MDFVYGSRKRRSHQRFFNIVDNGSSTLKLRRSGKEDVDNRSTSYAADGDSSCNENDQQEVNLEVDLAPHLNAQGCTNLASNNLPHESNEASFEESISQYHHRQKKASETWCLIKKLIIEQAVKIQALPTGTKCNFCCKEATSTCYDCGALALYCVECITRYHENVNVTLFLYGT